MTETLHLNAAKHRLMRTRA